MASPKLDGSNDQIIVRVATDTRIVKKGWSLCAKYERTGLCCHLSWQNEQPTAVQELILGLIGNVKDSTSLVKLALSYHNCRKMFL
jgi:hypothetical protein